MPEMVLSLKVCDPAMGSGAFLVEACRQLAARLVEAWRVHPDKQSALPPDEDEELHAKRLVAQRCLYGVDRNPMATDLARLSLWLATLARDHEFTFLDHALKAGDSLVGLTARQIGGLRWKDDQSDVAPFDGFLRDRVKQVTEGRRAIREAPDDITRAIQEQRYRAVEGWTAQVRLLGDATLAKFFSTDAPRARETARVNLGVVASLGPDQSWPSIRDTATALARGKHAVLPFHWEVEFPEVFTGINTGFDAIVGNPPFLGGKRISTEYGDNYAQWLQTVHYEANGNSDLVAHFFRRAYSLLRRGGCFGMIATNTIGQGDTRTTGLGAILQAGGCICRAVRRLAWPGEAAVVVSVVHVLKDTASQAVLDGRHAARISAYLVEGKLDTSPAKLVANGGRSFIGCFVFGLGFTFDDEAAAKGKASSLDEMHRLIAKDPRNAQRIFPYLGGEEVNTDPRHSHRRWVIDFNDFPLRREHGDMAWRDMSPKAQAACRTRGIVPSDYPDPVAADWPDLLQVVERLVKPERAVQKRDAVRQRWWQYADKRPALRRAISSLDAVVVISLVTPHCVFARVPTGTVFAHRLAVFTDEPTATLGFLQSRIHEVWTRAFTSTFEDRLNYSPSDCVDTFPFPPSNAAMSAASAEYGDHRAALMIANGEGLTKTYNRFHNQNERSAGIAKLRRLHAALDLAILHAYGWDDLIQGAVPEFLDEGNEADHRYQNRLFWKAEFRDEILGRLLDLNALRAEREVATKSVLDTIVDELEEA
jgi:hypothetical protein